MSKLQQAPQQRTKHAPPSHIHKFISQKFLGQSQAYGKGVTAFHLHLVHSHFCSSYLILHLVAFFLSLQCSLIILTKQHCMQLG